MGDEDVDILAARSESVLAVLKGLDRGSMLVVLLTIVSALEGESEEEFQGRMRAHCLVMPDA